MMTEKSGSILVEVLRPTRQAVSPVPVEVRDMRHFMLRARGLSNQPIDVPPGSYLVTAVLPDGEEAAEDGVTVNAEGTSRVTLSPPPHRTTVERPLRERGTRQLRTVPERDDAAEDGGEAPAMVIPLAVSGETLERASIDVRVVRGDWLGYWMGRWTERTGSATAGRLTAKPVASRDAFSLTLSDGPALVEVRCGPRRFFLAVPFERDTATRVAVGSSNHGRLCVSFDFDDPATRELFRYVIAGMSAEARTISRPIVAEAESAMMGKTHSPLRAVLGGYVLLRANELEVMERWTANLAQLAPWLPDTVAIRVECLARLGRHEEAVKELLSLAERGAPWFRSGIGYLAERARTYVAAIGERIADFGLSEEETCCLRTLTQTLWRLSIALDLQYTMAVYNDLEAIDAG